MIDVARLALLLLAGLCAGRVWALDPQYEISQYRHNQWTGYAAGSSVEAFAETPDGWLWIAGSTGAARFDGERAQPETWNRDVSVAMGSALLADADGTVWMGYRLGGVLRISGAEIQEFGRADGVPAGEVHALVQDPTGTVWVAAEGGIARLAGGRWESIDDWAFAKHGVYGAFVARDGSLWLATRDAVVRVDVSRTATQVVRRLPSSIARKHFAQGPDGAVWIAAPGAGLTRVDVPRASWFTDRNIGQIVFDRHGNLWMGGDALRRVRGPELGRDLDPSQAKRLLKEYSRRDGLSGDYVSAVFEDRFGGIWAATNLGLDRFVDTAFIKVDLPDGLRAWGNQTIVADDDGAVWIAAQGGPVLLRYDGARLTARMDAPLLTAGTRTPDGNVWFGGPDGVARIDGGKLISTPLPEQANGREVQAMTGDKAGALWVSIDGSGVYQLRRGIWSFHGGLSGLPRATALSATTSPAGEVWLGYADNTLARISEREVTVYSAREGIDVGAVLALSATSNRLWIGGDTALAAFDGRRFRAVRHRGCPPIRAVSGIVEAPWGDVFVHRPAGLDMLADAAHRLAPAQDALDIQCYLLNTDVLFGGRQVLRPTPTLQFASDARVWLASADGPVWVRDSYLRDEEFMVRKDVSGKRVLPRPEIVALRWVTYAGSERVESGRFFTSTREVFSAGGTVRLEPGEIPRLPPHTRELFFAYAIPMQEAPGLVRFHARLRGYSDVWQTHPTSKDRGALFTNVGPGEYRFEIRAFMLGDAHNSEAAAIDFEILPAYYQTAWFRVACVALVAIAIGLLFRLQLQRASARLRERIEARMYERERIARELHDTLLQGVQGLIMKIHAASMQMHDREAAAGTLNQALDVAQSVLIEGRDRVTSLRDSDHGDLDIAAQVRASGDRLARERGIDFELSVRGEPRLLHPIVREEAFLIAREAMLNAFRHANATRVATEIHFERAVLRVVVTDDGRGLPPDVLATGGRAGHWGMPGMRERASRIRGSLKIGPREGGGSRVELHVRSAVAYRSSGLTLSKLLGRFAPGSHALLALVACLYSIGAVGEEELNEVVVIGSRYNSNVSVASKAPLSRREIPASLSVVTTQRMEEQNLTTLADALTQVTGVTVNSNSESTHQYRSRGFALGVMNDGVPASQSAGGVIQLDNAVYERIEVLRGPTGLFRGSAEIGGAINLVSKRGLETFGLNTSLAAGSWDSERATLDVTGPLRSDGAVRARLVGVLEDRGHFAATRESERRLGYARLDWDVSSATSLSAQLAAQADRGFGDYSGLPAYTDGRLLRVPRSTNVAQPWNRAIDDVLDFAVAARHQWSERWSVTARGWYREHDFLYYGTAPREGVRVSDLTLPFGRNESDVDDAWLGVDVFAQGSFSWLGRDHSLTLGYNYDEYELRNVGFTRWAPADQIRVPLSEAASVPRLRLPYDQGSETRREQSGFYVQTRLSATDSLTAVLGGRLSDFESSSRSIAPSVQTAWRAPNRQSDEFTPSVGLVFEANRWLTLYASYADIFTPQSTQRRVDQEPLDPAIGRQYEAGVKTEWFAGALQGAIGVFNLRDRNRALADPANPGFFVNAGEVESKGWEAELVGAPAAGIELQVSYSHLQTVYLTAPPALQGQRFSGLDPEHSWKLWAIRRPAANGWTFGAGLNGQSETRFLPRRQGGFVLANAMLGYRLDRISVSLNANNLFDKLYYTRLAGQNIYNTYGAPRNYWLTIRLNY